MSDTAWNELAPNRDQQRQLKRMAVLRTGARLFADQGFDRTSLDDIAASLNVSKRTLYYYVKNKEEILFESHRIGADFMAETMAKAASQDLSALERIEIIMRSYMGWLTDEFGACLVLADDAVLPEKSRQILREGRKKLDFAVRDLLREGMADGSIKTCDPKLTAAAIFGAFNWVPHWKKRGDEADYAKIADQFLNIFLDGLRAR
jgi:AcrR family transcriptional regulator